MVLIYYYSLCIVSVALSFLLRGFSSSTSIQKIVVGEGLFPPYYSFPPHSFAFLLNDANDVSFVWSCPTPGRTPCSDAVAATALCAALNLAFLVRICSSFLDILLG